MTRARFTSFGTATGPSFEHLLGVDMRGRDVLSRHPWLARSLQVAVAGTSLTVLLGVVLGLIAGYFRGWADAVSRVRSTSCSPSPCCCSCSDSAPPVPAATAASAGTLEPGLGLVIFAVVFVSWAPIAASSAARS